MKVRATASIALALALAWGCSEAEPSIDLGEVRDDALRGPAQTVVPERVAECDGVPIGTPCGAPGERAHCIYDACVDNACGDGVAAFGEACDDANQRDGDGCSSRCTLERAPGCGNGVLEPGEQCDDGNASDDDRCTSRCTLARCGDGIISRGEACDDGNLADYDSCNSHCQLPDAACGNGRLDEGEACDDGNALADDECDNDCRLVVEPEAGANEAGTSDAGVIDSGSADSGTGDAGKVDSGMSASLDAGVDAGAMDGGVDAGAIDSGSALDAGALDAAIDAQASDAGTHAGPDAGSGATGDGGMDAALEAGQDSDASDGAGGSTCEACRLERCTSFQGAIDVYSGCFDLTARGDAVRAELGAELTPAQVQSCVDAMACAHEHNCGHDPLNLANPCYCGAISLDQCSLSGPSTAPETAPPCRAEWEAMTGTTEFFDVLLRVSDLAYPSGWAYYLLECESLECDDSVFGDCTP